MAEPAKAAPRLFIEGMREHLVPRARRGSRYALGRGLLLIPAKCALAGGEEKERPPRLGVGTARYGAPVFSDILALTRFLYEVASTREAGCRRLLDLYRALGDVVRHAHIMARPITLPAKAGFEQKARTRVDHINRSAKELDEAVRRAVACMHGVGDAIGIHDHDLALRINFHLSRKSDWYISFMSLYEAGEVDIPSRKLRRRIVRLASAADLEHLPGHPGDDFRLAGYSREADRFTRESLCVTEEHDLEDADVVAQLVEEGNANVAAISNVRRDLGEFIRANCTIEDLL